MRNPNQSLYWKLRLVELGLLSMSIHEFLDSVRVADNPLAIKILREVLTYYTKFADFSKLNTKKN